MTPSPLDNALKAAQAAPTKWRDFYNLFINSTLFVPTESQPGSKGGERIAGAGEKVSLRTVKQEGKEVIPVFDSLERLEAWFRGPSAYIRLKAHALVMSCEKPVHFGLNPGSKFYKVFLPEEIAWLRNIVASQQPRAHAVREGTKVLIGRPAGLPADLIPRLKGVLGLKPDVDAAYLAHAVFSDVPERPRLLLVLRADAADEAAFQAVLRDVGAAIRGLLPKDRPLDILKYSGQGVGASVVETVKPFYVK